jgi:hypothetical protein
VYPNKIWQEIFNLFPCRPNWPKDQPGETLIRFMRALMN